MAKEVINRADIAQKDVLTAREVAVYLGVSVWYVNKMCAERTIPYYKPRGKMRYFKRTEIDEWVCRNRVKTYDELKSEAAKK